MSLVGTLLNIDASSDLFCVDPLPECSASSFQREASAEPHNSKEEPLVLTYSDAHFVPGDFEPRPIEEMVLSLANPGVKAIFSSI